MAISGVGKVADQGLLAKTLAHMSTVGKAPAAQAVKEPARVKRVGEPEPKTALQEQMPVGKSEARSPMQLSMGAVAKKSSAEAAKAQDNGIAMESPLKLDIKA